MATICWTCNMRVLNPEQHLKWCRWKPPQTQLDTGTWYQSAVSGVWYENRAAAGDVSAVRIDGETYVQLHAEHQSGDALPFKSCKTKDFGGHVFKGYVIYQEPGRIPLVKGPFSNDNQIENMLLGLPGHCEKGTLYIVALVTHFGELWVTTARDYLFSLNLQPPTSTPTSSATPEQRSWNMGTLAQAAMRLEQYLRENVGDTADWPIHLHADNVADADQLAAHLSDFSRACRDYKRDNAEQAFDTVAVWLDWNPILSTALYRYGFRRICIPDGDGRRVYGWEWQRGRQHAHIPLADEPPAQGLPADGVVLRIWDDVIDDTNKTDTTDKTDTTPREHT